MKKTLALLLILLSIGLVSFISYDGKTIEKINILIDQKENEAESKSIISNLKTKEGTAFSQLVFDQDLKYLSENYDKVAPYIKPINDKLIVTINLWSKPYIKSITWSGNKKVTSKTLQKELGIKLDTIFNKEDFHKGISKIKTYYVNKGYYNIQVDYDIDRNKSDNSVSIHFNIKEGESRKIKNIIFKGFTNEEKKELSPLLFTKKYNILLSWLTGKGVLQEAALDQDQMNILNYLQNKGYADAKIDTKVLENDKVNGLIVEFTAHRGTLYYIGDITIDGNTLFSTERLKKKFLIQKNGIFSPEQIHLTSQAIQDLYGHKGYIETQVSYDTILMENEPKYDIHFHVEEGESFKIGLIRIYGNENTKSNVILRESLLIPGENFDTRKLKATQQRLENIGYFKNVNVYAVKSNDDIGLGNNYRDVNIEVEEASTGSASLFVGLSTLDDIFGGIEFTEKNFNCTGIPKLFSQGPSALRGGGEYAHAKVNVGKKQQSYLFSWLNPYFRDSLWRLGFEVSFTRSKLQSKNYEIDTYGGSVFTSYPITNFWTFSSKYRLRHEKSDIKDVSKATEKKVEDNSEGLISALGVAISYDSTDNSYKPHRGIRSSLDFEFAGIGGAFKFMKMGYLFTLYHPFIFQKGTMKYLGDIKFIEPVLGQNSSDVPLGERFFLGGENTVRGYKPYILGPRIDHNKKNPLGGISSLLLTAQYNYEIIPIFDIFAFFDAGSISKNHFDIHKICASCGVGVRLEIMNKMPFSVGWAYPIKPKYREDTRRYFFSMGGQF